VDIAKELQLISPETGIVFVTTSKQHAVEAFSLRALHYLVKPVTTQDIKESFYRFSMLQQKERRSLTVSVGRENKRLYLDEILRLQSANHVTEILLSNDHSVRVWMPIHEVAKSLDNSFLKIQRGLIVNMNYIEQMGVDSCILRNGKRFLLSRKNRTSIREEYNNYAFSRLLDQTGSELGQYK